MALPREKSNFPGYFFFLPTWTIFKAFIWYNIASVWCFVFFDWTHVGSSSPIRDWTHTPALEGEVLTSGPEGSPLPGFYYRKLFCNLKPWRYCCPTTEIERWGAISLHVHTSKRWLPGPWERNTRSVKPTRGWPSFQKDLYDFKRT